jgi:hypothetical protein
LHVSVTINNPNPTPTPLPNDLLDIEGTTVKGLKAGVDLSLYNEIDIPNGITTIADNAFDSKITSGYTYAINFPNTLINVGNNAFHNCVGIYELNLGNSVQSIGSYAFDGCSKITNLVISSSVTTLNNCCFSNMTGLSSLDFRPTIVNWDNLPSGHDRTSFFKNTNNIQNFTTTTDYPSRLQNGGVPQQFT